MCVARVRGRKFTEHDVGYAAGAVIGFAFGATEAIVEVLAGPMDWLLCDTEPA